MRYIRFVMVLVVAFVLTACYGALHLRTSHLDNAGDIAGTFDVVYYGARYADDPGSVVVLDMAGDSYQISPQALEDSYRIETGLAADEALRKGLRFLKQNKYYDGVIYHAIHALDGSVIGYEMMPEYDAFTYRARRTISVNYALGDNGTVKVYVHERFRPEYDIKTRDLD